MKNIEPLFENPLLEAVFRQAVLDDYEAEIAELLTADVPAADVSERHRLRINALFSRRRRVPVRRVFRRALRYAMAAVIAVVLTGCAVFAIPTVRHAIMDGFIRFYDKSVVFHGGQSLATTIHYELSYVPDGFTCIFRKPGATADSIDYAPANGETVRAIYAKPHFDGSPYETLTFEYAATSKTGNADYRVEDGAVTWSSDGCRFSVSAATLEADELLRIARSVETREVFVQPALAFWQPSYVPQGYAETCRSEYGESKLTRIDYANADDSAIRVHVSPADGTISATLADGEYSVIKRGGDTYQAFAESEYNSLLWEHGGYYFIVGSDLSIDELVKIAKSMSRYTPHNRYPYAVTTLPSGFAKLYANSETDAENSDRTYTATTYGDDYGSAMTLRVYPLGDSKIPPIDENTEYALVMDGGIAYHTYTVRHRYQHDQYAVVWKSNGLRFELRSSSVGVDELLSAAKSVKRR